MIGRMWTIAPDTKQSLRYSPMNGHHEMVVGFVVISSNRFLFFCDRGRIDLSDSGTLFGGGVKWLEVM